MKCILASSIVTLVACSSDPLEPGSGDQAGTGTNTLRVNASVMAKPRITNAKLAGDFLTEFRVQLSLNDTPVSSGSVTVRSAAINMPLAWKDNGQSAGRWEASVAGYDEVYQLDVMSGDDRVTGVVVDGPDIHSITSPSAGAALDATTAIALTWDRVETADEARLSVESDDVTVADTGTYTMSPRTLRADKGSTKTNRMRVTRVNRVLPAGAVGDSSVSVGVVNEIEVVAMPCPSC